MASPAEINNYANNFDIDTLMTKLTILERTLSNNSDIGSTSDNNDSITSVVSDIDDFNNRSAEIRDARLANSILSLDEDIPEHIDPNIKQLLSTYSDTAGALGRMEFIVTEDYLEYKYNIAAKKDTEKRLPRSNGRRTTQKQPTIVITTEIDNTTQGN